MDTGFRKKWGHQSGQLEIPGICDPGIRPSRPRPIGTAWVMRPCGLIFSGFPVAMLHRKKKDVKKASRIDNEKWAD